MIIFNLLLTKQPDSAAGQVSGIRTLLAWKKSDKDTHFLKATIEDPDGDRKPVIAGFAVWTLLRTPPSLAPALTDEENAQMEEVWPDPSDRQFMNEMWKSYIAPRSKALEMEGEKGIYGTYRFHSLTLITVGVTNLGVYLRGLSYILLS